MGREEQVCPGSEHAGESRLRGPALAVGWKPWSTLVAIALALPAGCARGSSDARLAPLPGERATTIGRADAREAADDGQRLLVVAPRAFRSALEPYLVERARQLRGVVDFLALEDVPEGLGGDAPLRLKRELHRRWRAGALDAVLLVGDVDVMPVRFMVLDRVAAPAFDTAFYPSDLYYADLAHTDGGFDDWNAAKDGVDGDYVGQVRGERHKDGPINHDGVSYAPEVAVGRWPVSTPEEARLVAAKTLRHQAAVLAARAKGGKRTAVELRFFFSGGWVDNQAWADALVGRVEASGTWSTDRFAYYLPGREPSVPAVAEALAQGPAALFHSGHGQPWGWEGCFDRATMNGAPATDTPPLLFSIGCSTAVICTQPPYEGYRDHAGVDHAGTNAGEVHAAPPPSPASLQPSPFNATSVSEEALRRPDGGAIVVIGCVTGSQPCALTLLDGFVDALAQDPRASAGEWWTAALARYVRDERLMELEPTDSWYPPSIFFQGMKFVYLGDPTVRLR